MAEITASAVKELREKTGLPMMDCKKALTEADGDVEKAIEWLRIRGKKVQEKQAGRSTSTGRIAVFSELEPGVGALIDIRCESAPVANNEHFIGLANDLAQQLAKGPGAATPDALLDQPSPSQKGTTLRQQFDDLNNRIREKFVLERILRVDGPTAGYAHHNGAVAVLLQVENACGRGRVGPRHLHAHRGHEADRPAQRGRRSGLGGQRARCSGPGDDAGSRNDQEGGASGSSPCPTSRSRIPITWSG